jgi:phenylalanyl-tRNA synthetase beta chain
VVVEKVAKDGDKSKPEEETTYKIEIAANRYDLLCVEGLGRALGVFLQK